MSKQCPRTWEVEAVRDGRLRGPAREALQLHLRSCAACTREQAALEQLATQLRAAGADEADDVGERRLRQQILAEANRALLQPSGHSRRWLRPSIGLAVIAVLAAVSVRMVSRPAPAREPLQLMAAEGARFMHERRQDLEYIELYEGSLDIRFDHRAHVGLVVRTPDGEVRDFGTVFRVTVARGQTAEVRVSEGAVLLQRRGFDDLLLRAGETFRAASDPEPAAPIAPPPPSAASDAAVPPAPQRSHAARASGTRSPAAREHGAASPGAEEEDRSYLHVLELVHAGRADEARAAATGYLRAFPNGFRRLEVERIAGDAR